MTTSTTATKTTDTKTPREYLLADHVRLDVLMTKLLTCVEEGDAPSVVAPWRELESRLLAHMALEEAELFPEFAKENAPDVAVLRAEHDELRSALDKLGLQIELHEARLETIRALIERLRAHAALEDRLFYPWINSWAPASFASVVRDRLEHAFTAS